MAYWKNELPKEVCNLPNGKKIQTDFVTDSKGYAFLNCSVGFVNREIESAIANHIGGWCVSTQQEYEAALELKKKAPTAQSIQNPRWFRRDPSLAPNGHAAAGSVAGKRGIDVPLQPRPDPIRVPTPEQMRPRKGPIPKEAII